MMQAMTSSLSEPIQQSDKNPIVPSAWGLLQGLWSINGSKVQYKGAPPNASIPIGLAVTDLSAAEGTVAVTITFSNLQDASAGILFGYKSLEAPYLVPQLGGWTQAYSIAMFDPGLGWRSLVDAGSKDNLAAGRPYRLSASIRGQRVRLSVDGVQVLDHVLKEPVTGRQVGLYAWGANHVDFEGFQLDATARPKVFVAMPFSEPFDTFYREVIKPRTTGLGLDVFRMDERWGPGVIFEDMQKEIEEASVVIADVTALNPNVFYEVGYAHALNKPTILLAQRGKEMPFDIRSYRVIFYDDTIGGKPVVERQLEQHLHAIRNEV